MVRVAEVQADHQAPAPHVPQKGEAVLEGAKLRKEELPKPSGVLLEPLFQKVKGGMGRRGRHRLAAEGGAVGPGGPASQLFPEEDGAYGVP